MMTVGIGNVLNACGIPYIRFCKDRENRGDYVIDRIRDNLA